METKKYTCNLCDKNYKSYKSMWNHNKIFHSKITPNHSKITPKSLQITPNHSNSLNSHSNKTCSFCNKTYSRSDNLNKHLNVCKIKIKKEIENPNELHEQINKLMEQNILLLNKVDGLQNELEKQAKLINTEIVNSNNITNNNSNNINSNNTINNNIVLVELGKEKYEEITDQEKINILKHKKQTIYKCLEYLHLNDKYPQYKNFAIKNNRSNVGHKYDEETESYILVDQNELVDDVIEYTVCDIEEFYEEFGNKLNPTEKDHIEQILNDRGDNRHTKKKVKLLIYNKSNKINIK